MEVEGRSGEAGVVEEEGTYNAWRFSPHAFCRGARAPCADDAELPMQGTLEPNAGAGADADAVAGAVAVAAGRPIFPFPFCSPASLPPSSSSSSNSQSH